MDLFFLMFWFWCNWYKQTPSASLDSDLNISRLIPWTQDRLTARGCPGPVRFVDSAGVSLVRLSVLIWPAPPAQVLLNHCDRTPQWREGSSRSWGRSLSSAEFTRHVILIHPEAETWNMTVNRLLFMKQKSPNIEIQRNQNCEGQLTWNWSDQIQPHLCRWASAPQPSSTTADKDELQSCHHTELLCHFP